jgi:hypothetical protein
MSDYPNIILPNSVEVQPAINTDIFKIIQVAENPEEQWVNAYVAGGPQNVWVPVLTPENYHADWNDDTVVEAVTIWAEATFPPSLMR